jgi:glyoxylase-like metal-dependent hydrolase (beta-lactamase superfamily II)
MPTLEPYEVYAVRYAHHDRKASENFLGGDPHDGPMPIDYFVWAIVGRNATFVLDTGFGAEMAQKRQRQLLRSPGDGLKMIGIDPASVQDVIISHMHYDHAGNIGLFPNARYHIQDQEMAYCTGRNMCHHVLRHSFEPDHVIALVRRLYDGKVQFHDGDDELAPGLSLHAMPGHTMGLQCARVWTRRGWVVLASDAVHFYANLEQGRPFPVVYNVGEMLESHRRLQRLADSSAHVVPGHDPLVLRRYPAARPELAGEIVRLDLEPRAL